MYSFRTISPDSVRKGYDMMNKIKSPPGMYEPTVRHLFSLLLLFVCGFQQQQGNDNATQELSTTFPFSSNFYRAM